MRSKAGLRFQYCIGHITHDRLAELQHVLVGGLRAQLRFVGASREEKTVKDGNAHVHAGGSIPGGRDLVGPYRRSSGCTKRRDRRPLQIALGLAELLRRVGLKVERGQIGPGLECKLNKRRCILGRRSWCCRRFIHKRVGCWRLIAEQSVECGLRLLIVVGRIQKQKLCLLQIDVGKAQVKARPQFCIGESANLIRCRQPRGHGLLRYLQHCLARKCMVEGNIDSEDNVILRCRLIAGGGLCLKVGTAYQIVGTAKVGKQLRKRNASGCTLVDDRIIQAASCDAITLMSINRSQITRQCWEIGGSNLARYLAFGKSNQPRNLHMRILLHSDLFSLCQRQRRRSESWCVLAPSGYRCTCEQNCCD